MKRRCWCTKKILWELNSFLMHVVLADDHVSKKRFMEFRCKFLGTLFALKITNPSLMGY